MGTEGAFAFHLHPQVLLLIVGLGVSYVAALRRVGPLFHPRPDEPPATGRQKLAFALGLVALWVALGWPLHDIAERRLYSAHMVQHLVLALVAPPLLLIGTPPWMAQLLVRGRRVRAIVRWVSRPVPALVIFNAVLVASHWPALVDGTLHSEPLHGLIHHVLLGASVVMWMPVLSPLPEVPRLSLPAQMGYLFLQTFVPTVPASFLTFGSEPLYRAYIPMPRMWGVSALDDMRIAGLIMKLGGGLLLWSIIAVIFFRWYAREQAESSPALVPASGDEMELRGR